MHAGIVGAGGGIVGFERTEQCHRTIGEPADVEAIFRDDQLALGIDPPERARHPAERVDADGTASEMRLEQTSLADVEPPRGIGGDIIGRPFAEMTLLG